MRGPVHVLFHCLLMISMQATSVSSVVAGKPPVEFDVPAMLSVHEIVPPDTAPVAPYKIIEIVVPLQGGKPLQASTTGLVHPQKKLFLTVSAVGVTPSCCTFGLGFGSLDLHR